MSSIKLSAWDAPEQSPEENIVYMYELCRLYPWPGQAIDKEHLELTGEHFYKSWFIFKDEKKPTWWEKMDNKNQASTET